MRIALLTDGIHPYVIGGIQKHSFYLAKHFALHNINVDLYHTSGNETEAKKLLCFSKSEKKFINSYFIPFPKKGKLPGHYIRESHIYSERIFELLKRNERPDFIYVQGLCGMKLLENKSEINIPVGVNFHGLEMFQKAADLKSKLQQKLFRKPATDSLKMADIVFSLGGNLTEILLKRGISKKQIIEIPIGIDNSWLIQKDMIRNNSKITFLFIGRYERRKGIEEITKVLSEIDDIDFEFHFVGNIPESKKTKSNKIHYWGSITDETKLKKIIQSSDVLVCPSYSEGMPTVILEAMASGLAILASDVGAVSELVDSSNGILIGPGRKNELKKAMIDFSRMESKKLLKMKNASRQKVEIDFVWNQIIQQTISKIDKQIKSI
jgi:glycosyltransferase involved in cell wall biosynthesis